MILPAILETDPKQQLERIEVLSRFGKLLHVDVADGKFVKTNNLKALKALQHHQSRATLELHLMVQKPATLFSAIRKINNVKRVVLHVESDWQKAFRNYKKHYEVGIALRPETPVQEIKKTKNQGIRFIQLLSVVPGAQGNSFLPEVYQRVKELGKLFPKLSIQIDGAMNPTRIRKLKMLGARDFVVGSFLKEGNMTRRIASLARF